MSESYYYLLVNIACISIPFVFSFHPKLNFHKQWPPFFAGIFVMWIIFIPWDMFFTSKEIWGFNLKYVTGIHLFNLPLEEVLFFFCIPYASIFTYHCFRIFTHGKVLSNAFIYLAWLIAIVSLAVAFLHYNRWYTFTAHLFCGLFLLYHLLIVRQPYLKTFMLSFLILLIPFIGSNGILTGLQFWAYPIINSDPASVTDMIVWYNSDHNLQLRIFSMPIDDLSYGLTMLLLPITVFEWVGRRKLASATQN